MKSWLEKLNDPSRDVYERRYRLLSAVSIASLAMWLLFALIADGYSPRILFFAGWDALFVPTMIFTLRSGRIQLGAGASGVVLVFLMIPFAFIYNGGIYAGAPNWCIIAMVFITMTVRGRLRNFLLVSDIAVTVLCYAITWLRPELVDGFTTASAYADSLSSLIITGALTASMFLFQLHIAGQEREKLERQQREILELSQAQSRFFSSMSHEIRTPVNTIVGLNEMILREDVSPEVAENAGQVRAAGRMLLHLVNDILDMSKLESGRMELANEAYDLGDMLSDVVGMLWVQAREKGLAFHVNVDPELPARLVGDEMRVRQILINVIGNAIKYTQSGSVTLAVEPGHGEGAEKSVVFTVSDTGMGIRKEDIPRLFSAFRRVESGQNRRVEGTGLGLAIVKQFVDLMGGRISVNSVYTQGSTFIVELPQGDAGAQPIGRLDLEHRHSMNLAQKYVRSFEAPEARALVVDDDAANRMVVTKLLRATGIQMDVARSGEEALQKTLRKEYHLIFMDHVMPGMDGVECLKRLRAQPGGFSKGAKVVALTANADGDSKRRYAREGFDGYLSKPCGGEALERECARLLPRELVRFVREGGGIVEDSVLWMSESARKEAVAVTTDSIADLPASILRQYRIGVIPHVVHTAEGNFRDGLEIEASGVMDYMAGSGRDAQTLPPDVAEYQAFFARQLAGANAVIHISISGGIRGSGCPNAREAAKAFDNVTVIDSGHLSSGEGLLAIAASRLAREGMTPARIEERLNALKERIHTSFIVDSLDYLERSELVSHRVAKLSNALMIRPVLRLRKGGISISRIYFGSRETAWRKYVASQLSAAPEEGDILFVTYVGLSREALGMIEAQIKQSGRFKTVVFQKASPAIAVNCGPGTFGLLFRDGD